ncbi:ice-binding family protein [Pedobacter immunditicola]|uniref:ice-binding family protein n=1 Tax=Pedobacter immunditicola TaxID=3133440 RepID=UPI00309E90C7
MNKTSTLNKSNTSPGTSFSRLTMTLYASIAIFMLIITGCKKDDFEGEVSGECPVVVSTDPMDKAVDVTLNKVISITFNTDMDATSINNSSFSIKQGTTVIKGKVDPTADAKTFTFTPEVNLLPFTTYTGTVTMEARDNFKTAMIADYTWSFITIPRVTLSFSPLLSGTIAGAGEFAEGSTTTASATALTGFTFTNWTENGKEVSTSSSYQFIMKGNKALVANFAPVPLGNFAVNLTSSPAAGGTTTGSGPYQVGTNVTVSAVANPGFTFTNWTENGTVVSTSSSFQFAITANRTLVANYKNVPASQFAVTLTSSPAAGGTTDGEGSYNAGTSVTVKAVSNPAYNFVNWTDKATGAIVSTSLDFTFPLSANKALVANFAIKTYTLTVIAANGTVLKSPNQVTYNHGTSVVLTATPNAGYAFVAYSGHAIGVDKTITVNMNADKIVTATFALLPTTGLGPKAIDLGTAGDFATLTKSGISTTGITKITGDIGVSPTAATAITGFDLIMHTNGESSHTPIVTGKVYASDYAAPTPAKMTTAVSDMETAFTTANGLTTPAPIVGLHAGDISGRTLAPGLYKWATGVLVTNEGVTLSGGPNDTWVFQISQDLTINNSAKITLLGGAQAKNIFWVVSGKATLGTNSDVSGIILSKTLISLNTGAKVTGRLLAQTAVTLNASTVIQPQ